MLSTITAREEDYLKAIYTLSHDQDVPVTPGDLVGRLGVSGAAVSRMTQRLADGGLVRRRAYQGVSLTFEGRLHALRVLRFHRLMEVFMVEQLGFDWAEVDEVVDELEHAMTEAFTDRLEIMLDYPPTCPHGDPIPSKDLEIQPVRERPLTTLPVGSTAVVNRVIADAAMMRYLAEQKLVPGQRLTLVSRAQVGGLLTVEREGQVVPLAPLVAGALFVRRPEES